MIPKGTFLTIGRADDIVDNPSLQIEKQNLEYKAAIPKGKRTMNNQSIYLEVIISKLIVILSGVAIHTSIDNAKSVEIIFERTEDIPNTLAFVQQLIDLENASVDLYPLNLNHRQS
ncbi:MAG: hypothetical protein CVV22_04745 [Ignavibacteriae bacterium HGW-Ignavibacteriae-1]|jgi:hypothetical protein|nr:MAG: hypothetical protein CVV22_04745 [Ignavibacteriae bacterium HGW-Ignavibacteriae-1]